MKKVAVLYIALGRYVSFWKGFYESCEKYLGACKKEYFIWTDNDVFDYSDAKNVHVTRAQKKGWPYDTLMRFEMFLQREKELKEFDYIYFFNANMEFVNPVDLARLHHANGTTDWSQAATRDVVAMYYRAIPTRSDMNADQNRPHTCRTARESTMSAGHLTAGQVKRF